MQIPQGGAAWNPLVSYPRNNPCTCGSGFKFKKCCYAKLPRAVPADWAKRVREEWPKILRGEIVFEHHEKQLLKPSTWRDPKPPEAK